MENHEKCENDKESIGEQIVEEKNGETKKVIAEAFAMNKADTKAVGENDSSKNTSSRAPLQPTKRRPDKDLNHDNWDQEDEPEEKGEFKKANSDQLKERKILTAKRKPKPAAPTNNPFGSLSLAFGSSGNSGNSAPPTFSFSFNQTPAPLASFNFNFGSSNLTSTNTNGTKESSDKQEPEPAVIAEEANLKQTNDQEGKIPNSVPQETDEVELTMQNTDKSRDSETDATKT